MLRSCVFVSAGFSETKFETMKFWFDEIDILSHLDEKLPDFTLFCMKPDLDLMFLFDYNHMASESRFKIQIWLWSG